jgi:hypothetical protein
MSLPSPFVLVAAHAAPIDILANSDGTNTHIADVRFGPGATTVGHPQRVNDLVELNDSFGSKKGRTQSAHNESAYAPIADIRADIANVRVVPLPD